MKNKLYIILCFCVVVTSCDFFQPESPMPDEFYIKMFGGEGTQEGVALQTLDSQTTYVFGNSDAYSVVPDIQELYLIKLDKAGNQVWAKSYEATNPNSNNEAVQMLLTDDRQHLLLLSNELDGDNTKVRVIKVDLEGNVVWDEKLNTLDGNQYGATNLSIIKGNTNFLVVGTVTVGTVNQIFACEFEDNGRVRWLKNYSFTDRQDEFGVDIMEFNDNIIVLGRSIDNNNEERPVIIEGDRTSLGEELQSKIVFKNELNTISMIKAQEFLRQGTNDFLILCDIDNESHVITTMINSEQSIIVATADNPTEVEPNLIPVSFSETADGSLLVTGKSSAKQQVGVIKYNIANGAVWPLRTFGLDLEEATQVIGRESIGSQIKEQADGTILIVGTMDFSTKNMIGVIKTNADGELKNN